MNTYLPPKNSAYSDHELSTIADIIRSEGIEFVLDPMAGAGGIHRLGEALNIETLGVEVEPSLAFHHRRTIVGDAASLPSWLSGVPAIVTAPEQGSHRSVSTMRRHLGELDRRNTGAHLFRATGEYEAAHTEIWASCVEVLRPGGLLVFVARYFIRDGIYMRPEVFHSETLQKLGLVFEDHRRVSPISWSGGNRRGVNVSEVYVMRKPHAVADADMASTLVTKLDSVLL